MPYSQKYCLVHFIDHQQDDSEFNMSHWPLHVTLADVFAIDLKQSAIIENLETLSRKLAPVTLCTEDESILGETPVVLLSKSPDLLKLHEDIVLFIEADGAVFNNPEFTRAGFIGHSTIQNEQRLEIDEVITIDSLSLVDMFPEGDWQRRKVLATFPLSK